jgi:hypothetical protein
MVSSLRGSGIFLTHGSTTEPDSKEGVVGKAWKKKAESMGKRQPDKPKQKDDDGRGTPSADTVSPISPQSIKSGGDDQGGDGDSQRRPGEENLV